MIPLLPPILNTNASFSILLVSMQHHRTEKSELAKSSGFIFFRDRILEYYSLEYYLFISHTSKKVPPKPPRGGGVLGLIFAGYVPLASQNSYLIIVYSVANYRPHLVTFGQLRSFRDPNLVTYCFCKLTHFLDWIKDTLLFICSAIILVRLQTVNMRNRLTPKKSENVRPHSSNSIENATPLQSLQSRRCDPIQRHIPISLHSHTQPYIALHSHTQPYIALHSHT